MYETRSSIFSFIFRKYKQTRLLAVKANKKIIFPLKLALEEDVKIVSNTYDFDEKIILASSSKHLVILECVEVLIVIILVEIICFFFLKI